MRVSADRHDPDWIGEEKIGRVKVFLDGNELAKVVEADDEAGTATVYRTDELGDIVVVGDEAARERLSGAVRIVID